MNNLKDVPPAGDVEVQRYKVNIHVGATTMQRQVVLSKDFDTHVTRLTAERDGLLVEVERWRASNKANALAAGELVADLQSELTKARELIGALSKGFNTLETESGRYRINMSFANRDEAWPAYTALSQFNARQPTTPIAPNVDESCGQHSEAAKGLLKCRKCFGKGFVPRRQAGECESDYRKRCKQ